MVRIVHSALSMPGLLGILQVSVSTVFAGNGGAEM